jgi:hypothetical protein
MRNFKFFPANVAIGTTSKGEKVMATPELLRALEIVKAALDTVDTPSIQPQEAAPVSFDGALPLPPVSEALSAVVSPLPPVAEALPAVMAPQPPTLETSWPIGSVFVSAVSTDPATMLGFGVWTAIGAGQFPVGYLAGDPDFGTLGGTGGAKTKAISAHAGTAVADHADHTHSFTQSSNTASPDLVAADTTATGVAASGTTGGASATLTHSVTQPNAHTDLNVLPPYLVLNFWQRTA